MKSRQPAERPFGAKSHGGAHLRRYGARRQIRNLRVENSPGLCASRVFLLLEESDGLIAGVHDFSAPSTERRIR